MPVVEGQSLTTQAGERIALTHPRGQFDRQAWTGRQHQSLGEGRLKQPRPVLRCPLQRRMLTPDDHVRTHRHRQQSLREVRGERSAIGAGLIIKISKQWICLKRLQVRQLAAFQPAIAQRQQISGAESFSITGHGISTALQAPRRRQRAGPEAGEHPIGCQQRGRRLLGSTAGQGQHSSPRTQAEHLTATERPNTLRRSSLAHGDDVTELTKRASIA